MPGNIARRSSTRSRSPSRVADVGRIVAAIGMVIKLATEHAVSHQTDALGILTDSADALVGLGVAISTAKGADEFQFGGERLVWTRKIINRTVEFIGDDSWACPCGNPHAGQPACRLQRQLTGDLHLVGGWLPDEN